jgi:hypothetical protein
MTRLCALLTRTRKFSVVPLGHLVLLCGRQKTLLDEMLREGALYTDLCTHRQFQCMTITLSNIAGIDVLLDDALREGAWSAFVTEVNENIYSLYTRPHTDCHLH